MKKLFGIALFLGIVLSSMLAFCNESESPPDLGEMEYTETPVVYSVTASTGFDLWDFVPTELHTPILALTRIDDAMVDTAFIIDSHVGKLNEVASRTAISYITSTNRGSSVWLSNIGYTSVRCETQKTASCSYLGDFLKYAGTETNQILHTSGLSDSSKLI